MLRPVLDSVRMMPDDIVNRWKCVMDLRDELSVIALVTAHHLNRPFHELPVADKVCAVRAWASTGFYLTDMPCAALLQSRVEVVRFHHALVQGVLTRLDRVDSARSASAAEEEMAYLLGVSMTNGGVNPELGRRMLEARRLDPAEHSVCGALLGHRVATWWDNGSNTNVVSDEICQTLLRLPNNDLPPDLMESILQKVLNG